MISKTCFAYTRVSTVKQGDGVSLEAQREAIAAFAERQGLHVTRWYEEKETAAKRGRPVFDDLVKSLQRGEAAGLIVHKIDRSARNFSDWARVGDLVDSGVDVHFAHESLDLRSRGGRLTADIQAVIAADYVRNLREECLKGIEGRLKQGIFPFAAPIGYLDQGAGKPKVPDPKRAPYVRRAFELYATQTYSFRGLLTELTRLGLRTRSGKPISKGCLEVLLSNPFYYGMIHIKRTGRKYPGRHEPLISKALFDRVQTIKSDRQHKKQTVHNHTYRRLFTCAGCGRSLYSERQKAWVYLRCHTKEFPPTSIREDVLDAEISAALRTLKIDVADQRRLKRKMQAWINTRTPEQDRKAIELQLAQIADRQEKLTDALLDGLIDKNIFEMRKTALAEEQEELKKALSETRAISKDEHAMLRFLELAKSLYLLHQLGDPAQKRRIAEIAFSNRTLNGKNLCLTPQNWLQDVDGTLAVLCGGPQRDRTRTFEQINFVVSQFAEMEMRETK
jgi:DNA invertase Pin-like site-specific DNA recombinase